MVGAESKSPSNFGQCIPLCTYDFSFVLKHFKLSELYEFQINNEKNKICYLKQILGFKIT